MSNTHERARANARELGDVPRQIAALAQMTLGELAVKYQELYGEPTHSKQKEYLRRRLAWRIQELAEGGLSDRTLKRIADLGDQLPESWRMRQANRAPQTSAAVSPHAPDSPERHDGGPRDPRLPPVGTVMTRSFGDEDHQVSVCVDGFEYRGQRFRTLSAVAKHITGTAWNGFVFFGLKHTEATYGGGKR
jgi:hypothetical protein